MDVDIEFIFDVVSPTAYLAWKVLLRYRPVWHLNVRYKPVFQGGIMQATGNQPPGMLPSRGMFLLKDMERTSSWYQVPMLSPPSNLFTLETMNLPVAVFEALVEKFFFAIHSDASQRDEHNNLRKIDEELVASLVGEVATSAGLPSNAARELIAASYETQVKARLTDNTKEAVNAGCYGVPVMFVTPSDALQGHILNRHEDRRRNSISYPVPPPENFPMFFFGSDRFEQMSHILGLPWSGPDPDPRCSL